MGWTATGAARWGTLWVLAGVLVAACGDDGDEEQQGCRDVAATIVTSLVACEAGFESPVGMCTVGRVEGARELEGTTRFRALAASPSAGMPEVEPTTLSYSGELELATPAGTLRLRDVGLIDQEDGTFTELQRISGGDGRFSGAQGTLFASGVVEGGSFRGTLTGELCLP